VIWVGLLRFFSGCYSRAWGTRNWRAFQRDPAHKGKLMDRGLWRYTRHPNYFGDACGWAGSYLTVTWS
jgi:steroid 5-alpha reductase family enzyme